MNNTPATDQLTVTPIDRPEQYCTSHRGRHVAVALVTGSVSGWYIERYACSRDVTYWTDRSRALVNNAGEPVAVIVKEG